MPLWVSPQGRRHTRERLWGQSLGCELGLRWATFWALQSAERAERVTGMPLRGNSQGFCGCSSGYHPNLSIC